MHQIESPDQWIAELQRYAQLAPTMNVRKQRLMRAALDGAWRRLHRCDEQRMAEAVTEANARLPDGLQPGFEDPVTGNRAGVERPKVGPDPSRM